ncbi:AAA family ATPase [Polaribacter sp. Hel_I_88]|uniref:AAA family ATPase n=1 Tax=Polaribacter sp. Hel_I_88 TaxID=1250006 RepID=UPI00047DF0F6|nr:AAA family ATPase [Polaribacter sp. Hel_I_88]
MDIKYIWVKNYKNLQDIDFNFKHAGSEEFQFKNGKLKIKNIQSKKPKAFFSENIKGLTAIVGKNGSGKTNLIEFLNFNLAHARNGSLSTYMKGEGIIVLDKIIFVQEELEIKNLEYLIKKGYQISKFKNAPLDEDQSKMRSHEMEKNKYIYYNPNSDFRILPMRSRFNNIVNISTTHLMNNDAYNSLKYKIGIYSRWENKETTDLLYAYFRNEKLRESDIILDYEPINNLIKFLPSKIKISVDHQIENQLLERKYSSKEEEDKVKIKKEKNFEELNSFYFGFDNYDLEKYKIESTTTNAYKEYAVPIKDRQYGFEKIFLINFFKIFIFVTDNTFSEGFLRQFIFEDKYELKDKNLLKKIESLKKLLLKITALVHWKEEKMNVADEDFARYNERELGIFNLYRNIEIDISKSNNKKRLQNLIKETKKLLNNQLHFHYQIAHELSSGEQNLLNFFARFYWAKNQILEQEEGDYGIKGERVVIFIDEGEIALHPEWQRQFFKLATEFLTQLFKDIEIQLILTTHSPFVLSDVPKENVIFMKRNEKTGNAEIADLGREKTFGANIYSLLSDSFFMENGTIGEFAKEKIEWVIEALDNTDSDLTEDDIKKIDYIISAIGEPLIKMQLESMRNQRLNFSEVSVMRKRIEELEREINKK